MFLTDTMKVQTIPQLLRQLQQRGVKLRVHGGKLKVDAPDDALTAKVRADLERRESAILEHLKRLGLKSKKPVLPELAIQYADFAQWQRQWLHKGEMARQLTYWKQQLAGIPARLQLPTDRPRPAVQTHRGNTVDLRVDPELTSQLKQLARRQDCTLFMTLLAVWANLLSRYSGQRDLVVGVPIANRRLAVTESLIGFFANTLPLRIQVSAKETFLVLLDRVKDVSLGASAHQDIPFEAVVDALELERALDHSPLFQVMFILQNAPLKAPKLGGLTLTPLPTRQTTAKFELTLELVESANGLHGGIEFNRDLFHLETVQVMALQFQHLLKAIARKPHEIFARMPALPSAKGEPLGNIRQPARTSSGNNSERESASATSLLPKPKYHYADFSIWQRRRLQGEVYQDQLAFWKRTLKGAPVLLDLLTDKPRSALPSYRGGYQPLALDEGVVSGLKRLAQQQGVTPYMAMMATFGTLLCRNSGQEEVVIGAPVSNRYPKAFGTVVGRFANTLPLRVNYSGDPQFAQLLGRVKQTALDAYAHRDIPFEILAEVFNPEPNLSHHPLFQVMLSLEKGFRSPTNSSSLTLRVLETRNIVTRYDLALLFQPQRDSFQGRLEFNRDLFETGTIQRLTAQFRRVLGAVIGNPDLPVSRIPLLSEKERAQIVRTWNQTETAVPGPLCIHSRFEAQVARTPHAVALVFGQQRLTYKALNRAADQWAGALSARGLAPETFTGVCLERSLELVIALLAVLKSGSAYVPLDPDYPAERLAFMIRDGGLQRVVTSRELAASRPIPAEVGFVPEPFRFKTAARAKSHPAPVLSGGNAAYMIYTSGSTGQPKGAVNTHEALGNRLLWMQKAYGLMSSDRVMQKTPFSFDVSVWEFFWPLITGAALVVARPGGHRDTPYLIDLITRTRVSTMHFVPSMLQVFLEESQLSRCRSLKRIVCSGEALAGALRDRFFERMAWVELHNLYGPTEAAIDVTAWPCRPQDSGRDIPIGKPIDNTQIYILDSRGFPAPIGVRGELHIGGLNLARGYFCRPGLTAERFVPDPFAPEPGCRLYKTGDVAYFSKNGVIGFSGRLDHQVKLRGFRIELGEIETQLIRHPAVTNGVVILAERATGPRLEAFVVLAEIGAAEAAALRHFLEQHLPGFAVPDRFQILESLPLMPNGKVDRKGLPKTEEGVQDSTQLQRPLSPTEHFLASIWSEVLHLKDLGPDDHFFRLGGHSLLATRVLSRIRDQFGSAFELTTLFQNPVLSQCAAVIDKHLQGDPDPEAGPMIPVSSDGRDAPLSFAQERLWFLYQVAPHVATYNIPVAVKLTGELDVEVMARCFQQLVTRHSILSSYVAGGDGQARLVCRADAVPGLTCVDLSRLGENQAEDPGHGPVAEAARRPFSLETGPLFRAILFRLGPQKYRLLLNMHHIVSDAWSLNLMFRDIAHLYRAFVHQRPSPLTSLTLQYSDFARWQRTWLTGARMDRQFAFWQQTLKNAPPQITLPTDRVRPTVQTYGGRDHGFWMTPQRVAELREVGVARGATPFMVLLSAYALLLARWADQWDLCIGTPVANRTRSQLEEMVGFFVNTLVMRVRGNREMTFAALLNHVRQSSLAAFSHQDLPFEVLVERLQPERDSSRAPLTQVMFALENVGITHTARDLRLPGLSLEHHGLESTIAKFDLFLNLSEDRGGLSGSFNYNTDLFDAVTVVRLAEQFQVLAGGIAADPEQLLINLPLWTERACAQALAQWNDTERRQPNPARIDVLFEEWALRTPHAVAIEDGPNRLTYQAVQNWSHQFAGRLAEKGVGCNMPVAVLLERGPVTFMVLLAILKAGAAYLPLDPNTPQQRLIETLQDAAATVAVVDPDFSLALPEIQSLVPKGELAPGSDECRASFSVSTEADLAYVIYTSGSTGTPKGVAVPHQAVIRLVRNTDYVDLGPGDSIAQASTICFDAATFEIWGALLNGGRLSVVPKHALLSPPDFARLLRSRYITTLFLTTAVFHRLARERADLFSSLRYLLFGGEEIDPESVRIVLATDGPRHLLHVYGPTENTTYSTWHRVEQVGDAAVTVPIGLPIGNSSSLILDRALAPTPPGVPGEIYLGGLGLAWGYLRRPALTALAFVPNPFGASGSRLYKTGDLGRWNSNGAILFMGRRDSQVKLRGFRIELGEVEAALTRHPKVAEASVMVREDQPGNRVLVAYLVDRCCDEGGAAPGERIDQLISFLKEQVPDYMVPAHFVPLEQLPLNENGKVDRSSLPAPSTLAPPKKAPVTAPPQTPAEHTIAAIWAELLSRPEVGIYDNFFDLGGHSILLISLQGRLSEAFGRQIKIVELFRFPTIHSLAAYLAPAQTATPLPSTAQTRTRSSKLKNRKAKVRRHRSPVKGTKSK